MSKITIKTDDAELTAELYDTPTAQAVLDLLPLKARGARWGDEIYFPIPAEIELQADARDVLESGELAYWPVGHAFCIFWGPTPASQGDEPRAASPVNVFGKLLGEPFVLQNFESGHTLHIEKLDD